MKFTPKSEQEIQEAGLLPKGIYDAEIIESEEAESKAGNPMIKINVRVFRPDGGSALIFDYLLASMPHKLRHCAYAVGFGGDYENGLLSAFDLIGRPCKVNVGISQDKNKEFPMRNQINDYVVDAVENCPGAESRDLVKTSTKPTASDSKLKQNDPDLDQSGDDIPF